MFLGHNNLAFQLLFYSSAYIKAQNSLFVPSHELQKVTPEGSPTWGVRKAPKIPLMGTVCRFNPIVLAMPTSNICFLVSFHLRVLLAREADRSCLLSGRAVKDFGVQVRQIKTDRRQEVVCVCVVGFSRGAGHRESATARPARKMDPERGPRGTGKGTHVPSSVPR